MSELLRLANKVTEWVDAPNPEYWISNCDPYEFASDTYKVIKGHQELIRQMAIDLEACLSYVENDDLAIRANETLSKARASLP